jgi:hypothetical protein
LTLIISFADLLCGFCQDKSIWAAVRCNECKLSLCDDCNARRHQSARAASHARSAIGTWPWPLILVQF